MLTPGQFVGWPMKANQAKYCKFAYSSAFGFSVPTGPLIQQIAPDNSLALSRDGAETWAVKWKCGEVLERTVDIAGEKVLTVSAKWWPWMDRLVEVETTLIPPTSRWPDWHIRIHKIRSTQKVKLVAVEGGFAIYGRHKRDAAGLRPFGSSLEKLRLKENSAVLGELEGVDESESGVFISSSAGASGVRNISSQTPAVKIAKPLALKPDANTNIMAQRTLIPTVETEFECSTEEVTLVTGVFAISTKANNGRKLAGKSLLDRWLEAPAISLESLR